MKHLIRILATIAIVAVTVFSYAGSTNASAGNDDELMRWDLIRLNPVTLIAVPGGVASAQDPATSDILRVTGSGQFDPDDDDASGGGTLVHKRADGSTAGRAVYVVTRLLSWQPLAGSIVETPIVDGVGEKPDARSGIATFKIAVYVRGELSTHAELTVHCALPGAPAGSLEGITAEVKGGPSFSEIVDNGPTVFHVLDD